MAITISGSGIVEANLADNAVTLAKMASGTDGEILTYDASGNPTSVSVGTDGQVLTSTGVGSPPAFEAAAAGGKVLQVVQGAFESSGMSTSSTGQVASGYTTSITPTTSGNKVLVLLRGQAKSPNHSARWGAVQIKDTTNNTFSDNVQTLARGVNEEDFTVWHIFTTTSTASHTYEMYQGSCDDQTKYYNRMNFLLMEIAQ